MKHNGLLFVRGVFLLAGALSLILALDLALDLWRNPLAVYKLTTFNIGEARHFNNLLNRSLNQLVGVVFTTVAIAVPLTANLYSLKFLEYFIKDRVNAAVLIFIVFVNVANTWAGFVMKDDFMPAAQLVTLMALSLFSFALLFPYLHYVFRFLHPNTLLTRLEHEMLDGLEQGVRHPRRAAAHRVVVAEAIEHIANIAIRSVDRGDRNTAIESVFGLERVLRAYWALKPRLAPAWFEADPNTFLGFSSKAVEELTASHSWVEMKLFSELRQVMGAAIPRMPELSSTIAKTLRKVGLETTAHQDAALREMLIAYFNTLLRLALNRKDPRSLFIIVDQYRLYAETLNPEHPDLGLEISYYFRYYGQAARDGQMPFVVEAVAHDLAGLVQTAWQTNAPNRQHLLDDFLKYDSAAPRPLPGVKKAQALLASYFLLAGHAEAAHRIQQSFTGLDSAFIQALADDLLQITREKYWEVNERRMNIDYAPEPQRAKLREFFAALTNAPPSL